jgi:hypothetical protein
MYLLSCPGEGCIYAVWTFLVVSQHDEINSSTKNPPRLMLSGETKFNLDSGGQVFIEVNAINLY